MHDNEIFLGGKMLENFERFLAFYSLALIISVVGRYWHYETGDSGIMFIILCLACYFTALWHVILLSEEFAEKSEKKKREKNRK